MIERGDLKNKVRFAAMSKNEDMKKTEKRSGGQVCQVAVVDVCFNVTVLEGALLVSWLPKWWHQLKSLIFITLVDEFNKNTLNDEICLTTVKFNFESFSTL